MADIYNGSDAPQTKASLIGPEAIAEQTQNGTELIQYTNGAVTIPGLITFPDVRNVSENELKEYAKTAEKLLSDAKGALNHSNSADEMKNHTGVCKTAICINSWLLYREAQKVINIKADIESGKFQSIKEAWPYYGLSRKKWERRKNITFDMINEATTQSLIKLNTGDWSLEDLPTLYQLNQSLRPSVVADKEAFTVLEPGDAPQLDLPENLKFQVIYGDLSYKISVEEMRNYIAEDAVGLFWIDDLQVQNSLTTLEKLRFTVKELCCLNTGKSRKGVYTNRQHRTMIVATKGKAPKPEDFTFESVIFEREIEKTDKRPMYYAEMIQQMFPSFPVLEIHAENFKYLNQNYLIAEAKGANNGTQSK